MFCETKRVPVNTKQHGGRDTQRMTSVFLKKRFKEVWKSKRNK